MFSKFSFMLYVSFLRLRLYLCWCWISWEVFGNFYFFSDYKCLCLLSDWRYFFLWFLNLVTWVWCSSEPFQGLPPCYSFSIETNIGSSSKDYTDRVPSVSTTYLALSTLLHVTDSFFCWIKLISIGNY